MMSHNQEQQRSLPLHKPPLLFISPLNASMRGTEIIVVCSCQATVSVGQLPAKHQAEDGEHHHGQPEPPAQHDLQAVGLHSGQLHHR